MLRAESTKASGSVGSDGSVVSKPGDRRKLISEL